MNAAANWALEGDYSFPTPISYISKTSAKITTREREERKWPALCGCEDRWCQRAPSSSAREAQPVRLQSVNELPFPFDCVNPSQVYGEASI